MNNIENLKSMSLEDRIKTIEYDLTSKNDIYIEVQPQILAQLLEVLLDAINGENPADWYKWATWNYVEILSVDQLIKNGYQIIDLIEFLKEKTERYEFLLLQLSKGNDVLIELSYEEKNIIAIAIADSNLNSLDGDSCKQIATYCINSKSSFPLFFQASLNGEYGTMDSLKTPYDDRDGNFLDVEVNLQKYLSIFLNDN